MEDINKELAAIWEEYASIDNEVLKENHLTAEQIAEDVKKV
jgi:hypothetical protein